LRGWCLGSRESREGNGDNCSESVHNGDFDRKTADRLNECSSEAVTYIQRETEHFYSEKFGPAYIYIGCWHAFVSLRTTHLITW
jgi:hypothetical protein